MFHRLFHNAASMFRTLSGRGSDCKVRCRHEANVLRRSAALLQLEPLERREMMTVVDDGDPGFSTTGNWVAGSGQMLNGDYQVSVADRGTDVASWNFTATPGQ